MGIEMSSVLKAIENRNLDLEKTEFYAAIIGESPSKGAKSPSLWNEAFKGFNLSGFMHPMDVNSDKLPKVVQCLRKDQRFIGGAVTMPYKISIVPYLDSLEPEAEMIGAVNCIYRNGEELIGSNTDGAGALWSLKEAMSGTLSGNTALLLGAGGAGFAVASYLASELGSQGCLKIANRSPQTRENLAARLLNKCRVEQIDWPISTDDVRDIDILINCTSIGFETIKEDSKGAFCLLFYTPLGPTDNNIRIKDTKDFKKKYLKAASDAIKSNLNHSLDVFAAMNDPIIFDIIYQPDQTLFLSLSKLFGYKTINGISMNLEQAVIAFKRAVSASGIYDPKDSKIRRLMQKVW